MEEDSLFEVSWEVCNKVGGINTVLVSKALEIKSFYKKNYLLIGPYFVDNAAGQFQEELPEAELKTVFSYLEKRGIKCHKGKWLIQGEPDVILIDFINFWPEANTIKRELWDNFKIDSLNAGYDFDEPALWSWAAGMLIEQLAALRKEKRTIAHFHEWLSGAGLLYLAAKHSGVKTVFTTHATVLGRTLANSNVDIYSLLDKIDVNKEIYKYNIAGKHLLEKASANHAAVFTTVSEITNLEAKYLLGKKADVILSNGLDIEKFSTFEEATLKHRIQRNRIREFLQYFFFPYYTFDLEETLIYFAASRYEFKNKGIDITIKALGELNEKLKKEHSKKTIVVFFWVPSAIRGIKMELLEHRIKYEDIKDSFKEIAQDAKEKLLLSLVSQKEINRQSLFSKEFLDEIKRKILIFNRKGEAMRCTHDLVDPNDIILKKFKEANLNNNAKDKVKVIFYPTYLNGSDGLLNLNYYESITGSHLGIFPSYYEPWGYTPMETAALGVASITTDLSGCGRFISQYVKGKKYPGIFLLKFLSASVESAVGGQRGESEVASDLADIMHKFSKLSTHERIQNKIAARDIAAKADWDVLIKNYLDAYNLALSK
ncbi:MAG: hypothetical protein V1732_06145 [Patescibacteria group bacterium]